MMTEVSAAMYAACGALTVSRLVEEMVEKGREIDKGMSPRMIFATHYFAMMVIAALWLPIMVVDIATEKK